jgi:hypothetical protein
MLTTLIVTTASVALVAVFVQTELEKTRLRKRLRKYDGLISKEEFEKQLDSNIHLKQSELDKLIREQEQISVNIANLKQKLNEVEEEEYVQSFGFYKSKYNFGSSEEYKIRLEKIRAEQSAMIKNDQAAICHVKWEVEGSAKKGKKMTNEFIKLVLRAFNGECDAAITKVKYNNVKTLEKRINRAYEKINKLSETNRTEITRNYLNLKLEELYLTHEFQEKKQEEIEEQRRIREQMREEEKAIREIEKARKEAEQEVKRREQALEQARLEVERAVGNHREQLELKIKHLTQQLEEAHTNQQRAISQAQMTKLGYVYILSNIGSFGENVYKIGMTRRLYPEERVRELSGAAVPFPFDVHAMISSENAPEMESILHQYLRDKSVNKVNERKEFFRVTLDEIASAVEKIAEETKSVRKAEIKFTKIAEAEQYRKTLAIEQNGTQLSASTYTPSWDEDEDELKEDG